tara:strand:- start:832 stop:1110 length:279 start_codon:yes stop_codon:yes gene_type:complete
VARAKSGTRMAYISVMSEEKELTWITNHYNGLLDTVTELDSILTETGVILQTELATTLEINATTADTEILSISFVADDNPTPIQTVGEFKAS